MHSQNACPVPLWSCGISAELGKEPPVPTVQTTEAYNSFLTCQPQWAVRLGTHLVRTGLLVFAHDIRKRTLCPECADQARPNLGDADQEGRVMGSECHLPPNDNRSIQ